MKFSEIPQLTKAGSWETSYEFNYFIYHIEDELENGLELNPDFQRGHVWTREQQIKFIEYYLSGGEVGVIYLNAPEWPTTYDDGTYVCVDGLQRITAFMAFYNGEIPAFGKYYNEYEGRPQHWIKLNVNNLKTKAEVLKWYIEMNSAGTPHTEEELDRVRKLLRNEKESD